ncbi:hypothetical protein DSO57_1030252 [Entomophthora muscae]|uniref:Uncharacterized protein n=1 Tax=Entomophthora muscae TaxID=34485 RepID=A0ACC2UAR5_9FUNG|nr:hypothetical protein DSO57_1030252 [Entomophthora muscae]
MVPRTSRTTKPRPVARADWEELADEDLRSTWVTRTSTKDPQLNSHVLFKTLASHPSSTHGSSQYTLYEPDFADAIPYDTALKNARRRIQLTASFDHMLLRGFPKLSNQADAELTLYISLTPPIASPLFKPHLKCKYLI